MCTVMWNSVVRVWLLAAAGFSSGGPLPSSAQRHPSDLSPESCAPTDSGSSWKVLGCPAARVNFCIAPLPRPDRFLRPQIVCLPALPGAALVAPGERCLIHFSFLFFSNTFALIFFDTTLLSLSRPAVPSYGC